MSKQNSGRIGKSLKFQPTSVCFLHQELCGGSTRSHPLQLPRASFLSWPLFLVPFPPRVCTSHAWSEGNSRNPVLVQPRVTCSRDPSSPTSKLAGGCPAACLKGGLSPERSALTEDPFLQTGSFDTFTESADLLTCGRGHVIPQIPHL